MGENRPLHWNGLTGGKLLFAILALMVVLLGSITLRRLAPAADVPMGQYMEAGFNFVTSDPPEIACNRLERLEVLEALARDSTVESAERYYNKWYPSCRRLKPGKPARVDQQRGLLAAKVCVRLKGSGSCMWTVRRAIERP